MAHSDLDPYEISRSMTESQSGDQFAGQRIFAIPQDEVEALRAEFTPTELWSQKTWPGNEEAFAPTLYDYQLERNFPGREGDARLILWYRTPKFQMPSVQQPVRGVLSSKTYMEITKPGVGNTQVDGGGSDVPFAGPSLVVAEAKKGVYYKAVRGDASAFDVYTAYRIHAKATIWNPTQVADLVGKTNNNTIFYGQCAAGTLLFLGAEATAPIYHDDLSPFHLWTVDLDFIHKEGGWAADQLVVVRKMIRMPMSVEILGEDLAGTDDFKNVVREIPYPTDGDEVEVYVSSHAQTDFSVFQDMLD